MNAIAATLKRAFELGNPLLMFKELWKHRYLLEQMVKRDLSLRYRGSFLGLLWSVINPLLMLLIYTFVFSVVFKVRWRPTSETVPMGEFALTLFAGLIPYNIFSEVISRSSGIVVAYPNYVKKVVFPLEILVPVTIGTALITSFINLGVLLVASLLLLGQIPSTSLLVPLMYIPVILLTLGIGWFLSSWGVYVRDVGQIVTVVLQVLFFITPIFYSETSVPEKYRVIMNINPLSMIVTNFRKLLLWNQVIDFKEWAIWLIITGLITIIGYTWFMATKRGFADVI